MSLYVRLSTYRRKMRHAERVILKDYGVGNDPQLEWLVECAAKPYKVLDL